MIDSCVASWAHVVALIKDETVSLILRMVL